MESRLQHDRNCFLCGKPASDVHHIFNGPYRKRSEEDGMVVYLCRWCHMYLHEHPGKAKMLKLKAQLVWESVYGDREAFIKRYGKNYGTDR